MTWWTTVAKALEERIGLDVESVGRQTIQQAVQKRASARRLPDLLTYAEVLQADREELAALVEEVVIPESWFFRDSRPFFRLQEYAREFWQSASGSNKVLRVLSLPCAGGEEAYSIAMALLEIGAGPDRFQIDALDVSGRHVEQARRGLFSDNALRGEDAKSRLHYFRQGPDGWELNGQVRGAVCFSQGNLLDADLLQKGPMYDVIFCRNLLIYLTREARERALLTLDRILGPNGLLFVGHAEMTSLLQPRFIPDSDWSSFAFTRRPLPALPPPSPDAKFQEAPRRHAMPQDRTPPIPTNRPPEPGPGPARGKTASSETSLLDQAAMLAGERKYAPAIQLCEQSLRDLGPSARVYFLLGMIRLESGALEQAESDLLKAIYLDNAHEEALQALAQICQGRGDLHGAGRYRGRAERAHQAKGNA
jgi:chemotaxis protein methyltransferase WspC